MNSVTHTPHTDGAKTKKVGCCCRSEARRRKLERKRKGQRKAKKTRKRQKTLFPLFSPSLVPLSLSLCLATPHTQPVSTDAPSVPATPRSLSQTREGYSITLTPDPSADGGRFLANFARTAPAPPCARVTRPQITRNLVPRLRVLAL